ncbi:hypothetical protein [Streptomyces xylophagus]|uniref:hypothetical protein n=1 Tax=Streptomyces xylophagus TaxID=285514 RepID=UPI0005BB5FA2|nr:hypothetical protein [Streptomyces xylophagus]
MTNPLTDPVTDPGKTRWSRVSRRRGLVLAGAVAVVLASGGVAVAAASGDGGPAEDTGVTLVEVPGAEPPHDVMPADPIPVTDVPVVVGDEGQTLARP